MGLMEEVVERKRALDAARPLARAAVEALADWYEVELTVSRLALEERRLSRAEVAALFVGTGAPVSAPTSPDRRFALNHRRLLELSARLTTRGGAVSDRTAAAFHGTLTRDLDPTAGRPRDGAPRDDWGVPAPDPARAAVSLAAFNAWSRRAENGLETAIEALVRLLTIRPFASANATVAIAVADVILARSGFPPLLVREEDAAAFRESARRVMTTGDRGPFREVVLTIERRELERCLVAAAEAFAGTAASAPRRE